MTNPAVAKWLAEIAAAKAKAEIKKATQEPAPSPSLSNSLSQQWIAGSSTHTPAIPAPPAKGYGIIASYNLRTRQRQLKLVLPPEPRKPGPGECCGNDCDPCVNTLYYQDLEAHRQTVQELKQQYEQACQDLENGITESLTPLTVQGSAIQEDKDSESKELSVRAYRPFKILKKQCLADNTLLIVCDVPSPSIITTNNTLSTFHILIRFQLPRPHNSSSDQQDEDQDREQKEQRFVTKAFTPVDLPSSHGKLTFLVKLYPAPHRTSELFQALRVYSSSSSAQDDDELGVLYLRGPVRTGFDLDHAHIPPGRQLQLGQSFGEERTTSKTRRVVMIAAGSGVTPMYQILQQYHAELARRDQEESSAPGPRQGLEQSQVELDLIYCNRTRADIWLRQELHAFSTPVVVAGAEGGETASGGCVRTFVRVQHILSSTDTKSDGLDRMGDPDGGDRESHGHSVVTSGRITPQILKETLTSRHSAWKVETSSELSMLSLGDEEPIQIVICGPEAFNRDVVSMLGQIGYSSETSSRCTIHVLE
ncbi:NADH-cytochrome b5 reductase-like [Mortierella antarctica]|nr:NADH-cytochrome b5 reductase-like [Mortierella antarctica]